MPKVDKTEHEKRIRIVMEYIVEDVVYMDIVRQVTVSWGITERQAKRYISAARERWVKDPSYEQSVEERRKRRIQSLKRLKRSLKSEYKGTPKGMMAIMMIEKEIIDLEGIRPAQKIQVAPPPQVEEINYDALSETVLNALVQARKKPLLEHIEDVEYTEVTED